MKILLFIVTYKASYRIRKVINEIPLQFFKKYNYKILISDDFSNDSTKSHINYVKKKYKRVILNFNSKNIGYGANIKKCMNYAYKNNYDYAAMIHGDNQYSPKYLKEMLSMLVKTKCASVTGSRMKNKRKALSGGMPIYKFIGNIFLTKFFNIFYGTFFSDCHTGYWFYDLKKIKKPWLKKFDNGFLFDLDMRLKLVKEKCIINEIPIITRYGSERSSIHFDYALRFFMSTIAGKFKK
ncbi:glycosyltransferase family 2 protein [Candidatus Pelagibacter sp.]|nr:glycosyltransferase family 2 protein [Candidatus Pelagibacter sp.]